MAEKPVKYREGRKKPITDEWRQRVRERLAEMGKPKSWLEGQLDLGTGALHAILHRDQSSIYVDPICELLGIEPPLNEDPLTTQAFADFQALSEERRVQAAEFLSWLRQAQEKK